MEEIKAMDVAEIAIRKGSVCADDLWAAGIRPPPGNVFGSVFRDDAFVFAGYTKSQRPEAHSNLIRAWLFRGSGAAISPSAPPPASGTSEGLESGKPAAVGYGT